MLGDGPSIPVLDGPEGILFDFNYGCRVQVAGEGWRVRLLDRDAEPKQPVPRAGVPQAPIVGASKAEHLDAPLAAVENPLTVEEIAALEAPYEPQAVIGAINPGERMREIRAASVPKVAA